MPRSFRKISKDSIIALKPLEIRTEHAEHRAHDALAPRYRTPCLSLAAVHARQLMFPCWRKSDSVEIELFRGASVTGIERRD